MWLYMVNKRIVKQLLSYNEFIFDKDTYMHETAYKLKQLGLINIVYNNYINCNNKTEVKGANGLLNDIIECNKKIYIDDKKNKYVTCPNCSKDNEVERKKIRIECISYINAKGIMNYLKELIESNKHFKIKNYKVGVFKIENLLDETNLEIFIPSLISCDNDYYYTFNYVWKSNSLFIKIKDKTVSHAVDNINSIGLWDIYEDEKNFYDSMRLGSVDFKERNKEIENSLNIFLENITGREFEGWVNDVLLRYIKENKNLVDQYLNKLEKDRYTLYGMLPIKVGASGYTDIKFIDKYNYLKQLFYDKRYIIDAKRYTTTNFTRDHLSTIRTHLNEDASKPDKAVVICTSNNIQNNAWNSIYKVRRNTGDWKTIIITKSLFLELLININAMHLLEI